MRLRLTVKRHGLPDTPVTWYIDAKAGPTVFQLLEQVNETIPIESSDQWGLEDYSVELKGSNGTNFECLHFQEVGKVMKEDDEVIIRPLLSLDLKIRRISGRHQISTDGRHLVDGLAFGRPLLRVPAGRPDVSIPPRKRQRLMITEDGEDNDNFETLDGEDQVNNDNQELVLHADFGDSDSEDDGDFAPGEFENSTEDEEDYFALADDESLNEEVEEDQEAVRDGEAHSAQQAATSRLEVAMSDDSDRDSLADMSDESDRLKIRNLHASFPKSSLSLCKHVFQGAGGDMAVSWEALNCGFRAAVPKSAISEIIPRKPSLSVRKTRSKSKKKRISSADSIDVSIDDFRDPVLSYYDQNGLPPGSIASGKALSAMAESSKALSNRHHIESSGLPSVRSNTEVKLGVGETLSKGFTSTPLLDGDSLTVEDSDDSTSDSSSDENEEATSTSGDSDSSSGSSDSSSEEESPSELSTSSSESASESSSDDDEPEEVSSKHTRDSPHSKERLSPPPDKVNNTVGTPSMVQPGHGKKATRMRNQRRTESNAWNRYLKKGILPAGTTLQEFRQIKIGEKTSPENALEALKDLKAIKMSAEIGRSRSNSEEFQRRREELLASLASGGVEVGQLDSRKSLEAQVVEDQSLQTDLPPIHGSDAPHTTPKDPEDLSTVPEIHDPTLSSAEATRQIDKNIDGVLQTETGISESAPSPTDISNTTTPPSRRTRLDLGAGRRLLFGALGIKNPKTKKDEDKVRNHLMKDVRPLKNVRAEEHPAPSALHENENSDLENWRDKIVYRAVECCHDEVELSEPPFPFQQRWDPQQQSSWTHTGNGRDKRKGQGYEGQNEQSRPSKKQKRRKNKHSYAEEQEYLDPLYEPSYQEESINLQYDESTEMEGVRNDVADGEASQQLLNSIQAPNNHANEEPDDLVSLPEDPLSLPDLQDGHASTGMIIAFKQFIMSAETNWQPQMSPYQTALVTNVSKDGLDLMLAKRDRVQSGKIYDEQTGDRIYGKFDMPIDDDEEEEEDDGRLTLLFNMLVEPKIVLDSVIDLSQDNVMEEPSQNNERQSSLNADAVMGETSQHAQPSHVTETQLSLGDAQVYQDAIESNVINAEESNIPGQVEVCVTDGGDKQAGSEDDALVLNTTDLTTPDPATPSRGGGTTPDGLALSTDGVSEENRKEISRMIKEAGFRSSIPSSVIKDMHADNMESPGDAAVFEKLLNDMTEIENAPSYSPKFSGLESPPTKRRQRSKSPRTFRSDTSKSPLPSLQLPVQAQEPPHSSWQTIDSEAGENGVSNEDGDKEVHESGSEIEEVSKSHVMPQQDVIETVVAERTTQAVATPIIESKNVANKPSNQKAVKARRVPVSKAQAVWEQLQPKNKSSTSRSADKSTPLPGAMDVDTIEDRESTTTVPYPKLSLGSSFTSQVTDHGRQPDFNFDYSVETDLDASKVHGLDEGVGSVADAEPELSNRGRGNDNRKVDQTGSSFLIGTTDQVAKPINSGLASHMGTRNPAGTPSDDELPTLEYMCSQPLPKSEKSTPTKASRAKKKKPVPMPDDDMLGNSNQSTPKASQESKRRSENQKARRQAQAFTARTSQPQAPESPFSIPQGSQVMDLTLSSEAEPEPAQDSGSENAQPRRFKKYNLDGDEDQASDGEEWVPKKHSSKVRRQASVGSKSSPRSSVRKNRRVVDTRL